ncbi:beta-hexosaminidase, partial [Pseudomonas sp. MPR-R1B]|uniref:glycoside hydrolase family 3 N-terminal domain-containing protein n=1 Tax=Pseudomonas sp. MPR-R1B TaxID=2070678 RepID=UPI000CC78123
PGHGRAACDSHHALPVVEAGLDALAAQDFRPFRALADLPMAMSAHVVFTAIDPERPATQSATVIREVIRGTIGFDGLLMSDDLSM